MLTQDELVLLKDITKEALSREHERRQNIEKAEGLLFALDVEHTPCHQSVLDHIKRLDGLLTKLKEMTK